MKNSKIVNIIQLLIKSQNISTREMTAILGYSEKTIRNYIQEIKPLLKEHNIELIATPSIGYSLIGSNKDILLFQKQLEETHRYNHEISSHERIHYILYKLLRFNHPLRITQLERVLYISKTSIYVDLKHANQWLSKYHLTIEHDRKRGIYISEGEKRKRHALCDLIFEIHEKQSPYSFSDELNQYIKYFFHSHPRRTHVIAFLHKFETKKKIKISTKDFPIVTTQILIMLERISQNCTVTFNERLKTKIKDFSFIRNMETAKTFFHDSFHVLLSENELYYFSTLFLTLKNTNVEFENPYTSLNMTQEIIQRFTEILYQSLDIENREVFENNLFYHLSNILEKNQFHFDFTNPYAEKIKSEFHEIYMLALNILPIIQDVTDINLPEDEISYITLHIASAIERSIKPLKAYFIYEHRYSEIKFAQSLIELHIKEVEIVKGIKYQDFLSLEIMDDIQILFTSFHLPSTSNKITYLVPLIPDKHFIRKLGVEINNELMFHNRNKILKE